MDVSIVLSIISIIISMATVIVAYAAYGLRLTFEFAEREDVLKIRDTLQQNYSAEIKKKLNKLYDEGIDNISDYELPIKLWEFNKNSQTGRLPTRILNQMKWNYSTMLKKFAEIIGGIVLLILFSLMYYGLLQLSYQDYLIVFSLFGGLALILMNHDLYSLNKRTIKLRNSFYELNTNRSFENAADYERTLTNQGCLRSSNSG